MSTVNNTDNRCFTCSFSCVLSNWPCIIHVYPYLTLDLCIGPTQTPGCIVVKRLQRGMIQSVMHHDHVQFPFLCSRLSNRAYQGSEGSPRWYEALTPVEQIELWGWNVHSHGLVYPMWMHTLRLSQTVSLALISLASLELKRIIY